MNKSTTYVGQHILSQILSLCPKNELAHLFKKAKSDYRVKRLKSWEHFVTMMFSVLSGSTSLRETCMGLEAYEGKLNHINIKEVPPRSTLSDANKRRPSSVFQEIFNYLNSKYQGSISDSTLPNEVLSKLFLVDSTVFSLFKAILKTSGRHSADGKKKGGIKKNTMLDGATLMPILIQFNAAADNDQQFLQFIKLPKGSYLTFDKGYNNYPQYATFTATEIFFITRQKGNAVYKSVSEKILTPQMPDAILKEEIIEQNYKDVNGKMKVLQLRRIAWWDSKGERVYEFISNNFELEAQVIADIYRYRWRIELFFKKLKQNFPLHYFLGDNQNAIEIQIWCALIALLLLSHIHYQNKSKMAFSNMVAILRMHLPSYISIKDLLALHNKKRVRCKKTEPQADLFTDL
ncbi:MAG: IS4 family transposase [Ferruginibacter sp.]